MGLIMANAVKRITASGGGDLECPAGQSFNVKGIRCLPSTNDTFLTVRVDRKTVAVWRVKGKSGNHVPYPRSGQVYQNLLDYLIAAGYPFSIPIAEGQTLNVSRYAEAGDVAIVYDIHDAGDFTSVMPNGSMAKEYCFMQYMTQTGTPTAPGLVDVDKSLSPSEYPDFPAGKAVPGKHTVTMLGLVGAPVHDEDGSANHMASTHLKMTKDREVLFDEDRNGLPFVATDPGASGTSYAADNTLVVPYTEVDEDLTPGIVAPPLLFDPPLVFQEGEEMLVQVYMTETGAHTLTTEVVDVAAILHVKIE